jgi:hypothetical protein
MTETWGTRRAPSDPDPGRLRPEQGHLIDVISSALAIIYLRSWQHGPECYEYCTAAGYRSSVVYDPDGTRYEQTFAAMLRGEADLIVVWSLSELAPDRYPRVEPVDMLRRDLDAARRRPKVVRARRQNGTPPRPTSAGAG